MGLLPFAAVEYASALPPAELLGRLARLIGEGPETPFAGRVGPAGFVVAGVREYRTTFLPVLRASVDASGGGSRVRLRARPHGTVLVFLAIWLAFLAVAAALAVAWRLLGPGHSALWVAGPALLLALTWRLVSGVFGAELRWTLERLREAAPELGGPELLSPRPHL